ncbi:MAG: phosphate ABC transporter substrate-binding protein, partial [Candidatus Omnitrophica bacterium]|nr:phosphate ABC transporter substrate-binding protein [Candidatus Omnitrophota bacterium]
AEEIAHNKDAIGYYGMGYLNPKNKPVAVAIDKSLEYFLPKIKAVISGQYPISRPLFFYFKGVPEGVIKDFLNFVLSDEGQRIVLELDFVPLREVDVKN